MTDRPSPARDGRRLWQDDTDLPQRLDGRPIAAGRGRHSSARGQKGRWLAVAGYATLGVACVLLAAVTFLLVAAPVDLLRDQIVQQVKARTGRDLVIAGPASITFFPRVTLALSDVSLSAPPDMGGPPTLAMPRLDVGVRLSSLLSRRIAVTRVVLNRPAISLVVDAQGRRSWESAAVTTMPMRYAQATGATASDARPVRPATNGADIAAALQAFGPANVRVADGTVRYVDERSGSKHEIDTLQAEFAFNDASSPLECKGSLVWRGEKVTFDGTLGSPRALLEERQAGFRLHLAGRPFEASYDGRLALGEGIALEGAVSMKAPSAAVLMRWLGGPSGGERELGALALTSLVTAVKGEIGLSDIKADIGESVLSGELAIATHGVRPHVRGQLKLSELDFGRLLVRSSPPAGEQAVRPQPSDDAAPNAIEDILRRGDDGARRTQVRGFTRRTGGAGWSDDIIDLAPLGIADADLMLSVDRVTYKDVTTGPSRLALAVKDRVATIKIENMQLYNGRGQGLLTLDGNGQVPVASVNLEFEGVSVAPLLKDALGFEWLGGRGHIRLALAGQGISERQIVETLNGKVEMMTTNGAIAGFDVAKALKGLERGRLSGLKAAPGDTTPFSELAGTFLIANGMAQNQDMRLVSPHIRVTGAGTANLPLRQIDYTVRPKIVASQPADHGAVVNLAGLEIPVRISGPWEKPTFTPELKGVLKDPEQASDTLKQVGKNLKSPEVQDAIRGLLGGGDGQQRVKPRELIEKLLKKD